MTLQRDVTVLMEKVQAVDTEYQFVASGLRGYLEQRKDYKTTVQFGGGFTKLSILALSNLLDTFLVYLSLVTNLKLRQCCILIGAGRKKLIVS